MSRFCPKCGNKRNNNETYCSSCGTYLSDKQTAGTPVNNETIKNETMGTFIRYIFNVFKAVFHWITHRLDASYRKKYGSDYTTLSSDEKYNVFYREIGKSTKLIYGMMLGTIISFLLYGYTQEDSILVIYSLILIVLAIINLSYMLIYLYNLIRSNWSEIAIKIITGLIISFFLIALSAVFPPLALVLICLTIYKNWKRRAFLDRYKRYTRILLKGFFIVFASQIICAIFEFMAKITASRLENLISYSIGHISEAKLESLVSGAIWRVSIYEALALCSIFAGLIIWNRIYCNFYKSEHEKGIQYDDCVKLTWLVPLTWLMLAFSYLTLIHSSSFNGDSLLADMDANIDTYLDMDSAADITVSGKVVDESYTLATDLGDASFTVHNTFTNIDNFLTPNSTELNTAMPNVDQNNILLAEENSIPSPVTAQNEHIGHRSISDINPPMPEPPDPSNTINSNHDTISPISPHNSSYAIYDDKGTFEAKLVQNNESTFNIQDSQGMQEASAHVDSITGDISLNDSSGIRQGTITNDGIIKGVDELTDGRIVTQYNGDRVIQDSMNQTIGYIHRNGIITDSLGKPLGRIK